jgi:hypothetical protein
VNVGAGFKPKGLGGGAVVVVVDDVEVVESDVDVLMSELPASPLAVMLFNDALSPPPQAVKATVARDVHATKKSLDVNFMLFAG